MVVREMIATARERIAKFREAEKMVGARGGAERQRERGASSTHIQEAAGTLSAGRHVDESFTYAEKESYVRFAPFMGMRSCVLGPRSEMQGRKRRVGRLARRARRGRVSVSVSVCECVHV